MASSGRGCGCITSSSGRARSAVLPPAGLPHADTRLPLGGGITPALLALLLHLVPPPLPPSLLGRDQALIIPSPRLATLAKSTPACPLKPASPPAAPPPAGGPATASPCFERLMLPITRDSAVNAVALDQWPARAVKDAGAAGCASTESGSGAPGPGGNEVQPGPAAAGVAGGSKVQPGPAAAGVAGWGV